MNLDLRCYLVTSGSGYDTINAAAEAARAGAGIIQVRGKDLSTAELFSLTCAVADSVHTTNPQTRVVVNDRVDVVLAARDAGVPVHGVHLGQDDLPATNARAVLGTEAIVGLSAGSLELVRQADTHREAIDYLGVGPFRPTPTKGTGRQPVGSGQLPADCRSHAVAHRRYWRHQPGRRRRTGPHRYCWCGFSAGNHGCRTTR